MPNATQMLRQDHKKVEALFNKFEQGKAMDAKRAVAEQAMNELEIHAQVEEQIFYPAARKAIVSSELVDEATKEHQEAKSLISQLKKTGRQAGNGSDFESLFSELMQAIKHHVEEEEGEMFPQAEDSELDLAALGAQMLKRKQELTKSLGSPSSKSTRSTSPSKSKSTRKTKSRSKTKSRTKTTRGSNRKRARAR